MENKVDMPMSFSFQFGMNPKAMDAYGKLDDEEKRQVILLMMYIKELVPRIFALQVSLGHFC